MANQNNQKIKVIHFGAGNLFGGVEVMLITMAKYQQQCPRLDQSFAFFFDGKVANRIQKHGCRVKLFPETKIKNIFNVLRTQKAIRDHLISERPDLVVVHGQWVHFIVAGVAKNLGIKLAHWSHDPPTNRNLVDWYIKYKKPDFFICNSEYTRTKCQAFLRDVEKFIVHCPVEDLYADEKEDDILAFRENWDTALKDVVFLHVARWEPHKGHIFLLEGAARLLKKRSDWKIWFVGEPQREHELSYRRQVSERTEKLGLQDQVRFLGWQEDLSKVLCSSDVYCQPNTAPEPFGISIIEAMYCGLPVIATPLGGPKETVDQSCGKHAEPGNSFSLESAMLDFFEESKRESLGAGAKKRAASLSSPKSQLEKFATLIS